MSQNINFVTSLVPIQDTNVTPVQSDSFNFIISPAAQATETQIVAGLQTVFNNLMGYTQQQWQTAVNATSDPPDLNLACLISNLRALNTWAQYQQAGQNPSNATISYVDPSLVTHTVQLSTLGTMDPGTAGVLNQMDGMFSAAFQAANRPDLVNSEFIHDLTTPLTTAPFVTTSIYQSAVATLNGIAPTNSSLSGGNPALVAALQGAFTRALSAISSAEVQGVSSGSIQQILMTDYVNTGNDLLYSQMTQLNSALNTNQQVLTYLNSLQDLMNQKDPTQFILNLQALSNSGAGLNPSNYTTFESQNFNQTINTQAKFLTDNGLSSYITGLQNNDPTILPAFASATGSGPFVAQTLITNLTNLAQQVESAAGGSGTQIQTSLNQIITDIKGIANSDSTNTITAWVQDIQSGTQGSMQNDLNNAITAAQSFNTVNQEQLNNVMFIFQQFYQSASSLLSNINQLVQSMSSKISR